MRNSSIPNGRSTSYAQPNLNYGPYREGPGSDVDSGAPRSDSGYYTHQVHSVISNDPEPADQEMSSAMTYGVSRMNVGSTSSEPTKVFHMQSDQTSQYSGRSISHSKQSLKCPRCKETSKCPSDAKCVAHLAFYAVYTNFECVENTCSNMISLIHAMFMAAVELRWAKALLPKTTLIGTRRASIE
jgi:hypothetical protein